MAHFEDKPDATDPVDPANVIVPAVELDGPTDVKLSLTQIIAAALAGGAVTNRIDDFATFETMYGTVDTASSTEFDGTALTTPQPSGAAWINQAGRTYNEDNGFGRITTPASSNPPVGAFVWAKPASAFTIYAKIEPVLAMNYNGSMVVLAAPSGEMVALGPFQGPGLRLMNFNTGHAFGGDYATLIDASAFRYYKISFDGASTLTAAISSNGEVFTQFYRNASFVITGGFDRIGIGSYADVAQIIPAQFDWFRVVL